MRNIENKRINTINRGVLKYNDTKINKYVPNNMWYII